MVMQKSITKSGENTMNKEKLNKIFCDVFNDENIIITDDTTAEDIEDWDSLSNITLIAEIEDAFNIEFSMQELMNIKNVGAMINIINKKVQNE